MNSRTKQRMPFWEIRQALNRDGVLQLSQKTDVTEKEKVISPQALSCACGLCYNG